MRSDSSGSMRRLLFYVWDNDRSYGKHNNVKYYFDESGRLICVSGPIAGTISFDMYYHYVKQDIVWIVFRILNAAGGSRPVVKKFYL